VTLKTGEMAAKFSFVITGINNTIKKKSYLKYFTQKKYFFYNLTDPQLLNVLCIVLLHIIPRHASMNIIGFYGE